MTDYMKCDARDLPKTAKQKAVDWANENKYEGIPDWIIGHVNANSTITSVARYIATQDTATKPSTESHEDAAERIASQYWSDYSISWDAARLSFLHALDNGDLVIPAQPVKQAKPEPDDPDLVNARILATEFYGVDYTDGKSDDVEPVHHYLGWLKSGLIKMGDGL